MLNSQYVVDYYNFPLSRFPQRYPNVLPELTIDNPVGLSDAFLEDLKRGAIVRAKELLGQEMIFEIATNIIESLSTHESTVAQVIYLRDLWQRTIEIYLTCRKKTSFYEQMLSRQQLTSKASVRYFKITELRTLQQEHEMMKKQTKKDAEEKQKEAQKEAIDLAKQIGEEIQKKEAVIKKERQKHHHKLGIEKILSVKSDSIVKFDRAIYMDFGVKGVKFSISG
jgi:hypothetical protein